MLSRQSGSEAVVLDATFTIKLEGCLRLEVLGESADLLEAFTRVLVEAQDGREKGL